MIRGTTKVVGVFGWPVKHSASPAMHNAAFAALGLDFVYAPFAVSPETVEDALKGVRALNLAGVNVTVPLKELIPPYMDELTERARVLGAVNTVVHRDGKLFGDSTDGPGFIAALVQGGFPVGNTTRAVVLGAGGSARAVVRSLLEAGTSVIVANRNVNRAAVLAQEMQVGLANARIDYLPLETDSLRTALMHGTTLLVNTTSVGMHPNDNEMPPVLADALHPGIFVVDLIYNPAQTRLLTMARGQGCRIQNGIEMLVRQGAIAFEQWTGISPPIDVMRTAVQNVLGMKTEK